jgi:hypothetical protein
MWQLLAALLIVSSATNGAFIVLYNTPPVGIGCRAAGFMVFSILAIGSYMVDMLGSWLHHRARRSSRSIPPLMALTTAKVAGRVVCVALTVLEVLTSSFLVLHLLGQMFPLVPDLILLRQHVERALLWRRRRLH